jgi:uncharacterized protein (DUF1800 family)
MTEPPLKLGPKVHLRLTRRELFGGTIALGSIAGISTLVGRNTSAPQTAAVPASLTGVEILGTDPDIHLVRRASYGLTPEMVSQVAETGSSAWLDAQLQPQLLDAPIEAAIANTYPYLSWSAAEIAAGKQRRDPEIERFPEQILKANIARALWSPRQLQEVMTDLWSNHFNVPYRAADTLQFRHLFDDTIRSHALGSFSDLLVAAVLHPAMLNSLNNSESTRVNPNENLGRELLELHTLGIGNYTEQDVKNSALLLTGFTVKNNEGTFDPTNHFVGPLTIAGKTYANSRADAGRNLTPQYLRDLARNPATATRVATVLATHFVSDTPSAELVRYLAQVYLAHETEIVPVLRAMFASQEFAQSIGAKSRRPYEDMIATVRMLGYRPEPISAKTFEALYALSRQVGQPPLSWPTPDGYPDTADSWLSPSQLLARMNMHADLAARRIAELKPNLTSQNYWMAATPPSSWNAVIDTTSQALLATTILDTHRDALLAMIGESGAAVPTADALTTAIPQVIVPALLNSPYHWSY